MGKIKTLVSGMRNASKGRGHGASYPNLPGTQSAGEVKSIRSPIRAGAESWGRGEYEDLKRSKSGRGETVSVVGSGNK